MSWTMRSPSCSHSRISRRARGAPGYSANRSRSRQRSALDVAPDSARRAPGARRPRLRAWTTWAHRRPRAGQRRRAVHRPFTTRSLAGNRNGTRLLDLPALMLPSTQAGEVIKAGELEIRPSEHLALAGGRTLSLSVRELDLLAALGRREGRDRAAGGAVRDGVGRADARPPTGRWTCTSTSCGPSSRTRCRSGSSSIRTSGSATGSSRSLHSVFTRSANDSVTGLASGRLRGSRRHDYGEGRVR